MKHIEEPPRRIPVMAETMVTEAGITPLLHCFAVDAIMEGDTIKGIITESKSGRQAILAKRVIDATGDADIIAHAGAPYRKGSKGIRDIDDNKLRESSYELGISRLLPFQAGKMQKNQEYKTSLLEES